MEQIPLQSSVVPDIDEILSKAQQQHRQLVALRDATYSFLRRDARLSQLREHTLLIRSRAKFEWKTCYEYRKFVRQSQEAFNEQSTIIVAHPSSDDYNERAERLHKLHEQVMRDFNAQNAYAERANDLQTELGGLEHELQMKEAATREAAETMRRILGEIKLPANSSAATAVETEVPPSPSTQSSESLDPLIDRYFQKLGVLKNLLEESVENEVDYADARAERNFKAEHDQLVESSDDDFEVKWRALRDNLSHRIVEARRVADRARNVCLDDGLDPEKYRRRLKRDSDRSVSGSVQDEFSQLLPALGEALLMQEDDLKGTRSSPGAELGSFRILTPRTWATRHEPRSQTTSSAPPEDRVLNWIHDLDEPDRTAKTLPNALSSVFPERRSLPASIAPELHTTQLLDSNSLQTPLNDNATQAGKVLYSVQSQDLERQRRRLSDSDIAGMLSKDVASSGFVKDLRSFAFAHR